MLSNKSKKKKKFKKPLLHELRMQPSSRVMLLQVTHLVTRSKSNATSTHKKSNKKEKALEPTGLRNYVQSCQIKVQIPYKPRT